MRIATVVTVAVGNIRIAEQESPSEHPVQIGGMVWENMQYVPMLDDPIPVVEPEGVDRRMVVAAHFTVACLLGQTRALRSG